MQTSEYDLFIIGGGINGAGIARDAAGRGLSVLLVDAGDLAGATSSASTKLIHGGLRYLEHMELRLVRESLRERERLMGLAPHIISPMDFVLPHDAAQRPYLLIRAGLFLYDNLARRRRLHRSRGVRLDTDPVGEPLNPDCVRAVCYADCWVDDSRLVILNAVAAAARGAEISTRVACVGLKMEGKDWIATLRDVRTGQQRTIKAAMVVNAAGPWVRGFIEECGLGTPQVPKVRLVKGSHIIVRRAYSGSHAYILQQPDKRVVFVIPYEGEYTLIGTTEQDFNGDPLTARISDAETEYLCAAFNRAFKKKLTAADVEWNYSGVRPLFDDGGNSATRVTRDYRIYHHGEFRAPMLSVFGGKLTTYRVLAEQVVNRLLKLGDRPGAPWTATQALPGGNIKDGDFNGFLQKKGRDYPWLPAGLLRRYARAYGTRMDVFLEGARGIKDLGADYGDGLYEAEVVYMVRAEFAQTEEDILWRRSKLGIHVSDRTVERLRTALPRIVKAGGS